MICSSQCGSCYLWGCGKLRTTPEAEAATWNKCHDCLQVTLIIICQSIIIIYAASQWYYHQTVQGTVFIHVFAVDFLVKQYTIYVVKYVPVAY